MDAFLQKHHHFDDEDLDSAPAPKFSFPWDKKPEAAPKEKKRKKRDSSKSKSKKKSASGDDNSDKKRKKRSKSKSKGDQDVESTTKSEMTADAETKKTKRSSKRKSSKSKSSKPKPSAKVVLDPSFFDDVDLAGMDVSLEDDPYKLTNKKQRQKSEVSANWLSRVRIRPSTARHATEDEFDKEMATDVAGPSTDAPKTSTTDTVKSLSAAEIMLQSRATLDRASRSKEERQASRATEPRIDRKPVKMQSLDDFLDDSNSDIQSMMSEEDRGQRRIAGHVTEPPPTNAAFRKGLSPDSDNDSRTIPTSNTRLTSTQMLSGKSSPVSERSHDSDRMNVNLASYLGNDNRRRSPDSEREESPQQFRFVQQHSESDTVSEKSSVRMPQSVADLIPSRATTTAARTRNTKRKTDNDTSSMQSADLDPFRFANYDEDPMDATNLEDTSMQDDIMSQLTSDSNLYSSKQKTSAAASKPSTTASKTNFQTKLASPPSVHSADDDTESSGGALMMMADDLSSVDNKSEFNLMSTSQLMDSFHNETRSVEEEDPAPTKRADSIPSPTSELSMPSFRSHESLLKDAPPAKLVHTNTQATKRTNLISTKETTATATKKQPTLAKSIDEYSFDELALSLDEFDAPDLPQDFEAEFDMDLVNEFEMDADFQKELEAEMERIDTPAHGRTTQHQFASIPKPAPAQQKSATPKVTMETQTPYYSAAHSYMPTPDAGFVPTAGAYLSQVLGQDYIQKKAGLQATLLAQNEMFKHQLDMIKMNLVQTQMQMLQSTGITPSWRMVKEAWGESTRPTSENAPSNISTTDAQGTESSQDKENVSPALTMEELLFEQLRKQQETLQQSKKRHRYTTLEDTRAYLRLKNNFIS